MRHASSCTLLVLACAIAAAADGAASDPTLGLRVVIGGMPESGAARIESHGATDEPSGTWDAAARVAVGAWRNFDGTAPLSFTLGAGLAYTGYDTFTSDASGASSGVTTRGEVVLNELGIFVEPGLAWNAAPRFQLEAGVQLGAGTSNYRDEAGDHHRGSYAELGLVLRPVVRFERVQVFAEGGALSHTSKVTAGDDTLTFTSSGGFVRLGVGFVF